jgi:hypothetical protein
MVVAMVLFFLIGLAALLRGIAMISVPTAWMVFGTVCLAVAAWPAIRER